jgi:hypothetical protein
MSSHYTACKTNCIPKPEGNFEIALQLGLLMLEFYNTGYKTIIGYKTNYFWELIITIIIRLYRKTIL